MMVKINHKHLNPWLWKFILIFKQISWKKTNLFTIIDSHLTGEFVFIKGDKLIIDGFYLTILYTMETIANIVCTVTIVKLFMS